MYFYNFFWISVNVFSICCVIIYEGGSKTNVENERTVLAY